MERFSNDVRVHAMTRKTNASKSVELLHAEILRDDGGDDGVVVDGRARDVGQGLPCGLGISLLCGQYEDDRLELSLHTAMVSPRCMEPDEK